VTKDGPHGQVSPWERVLAGVGALLVAGMLGYLGHEAVSGDRSPPALQVRLEEVRAQGGGGFLVRFSVHNAGGRAAAQVRVRAEAAGTAAEAAETVLDYVPAHSERGGGLLFREDPRARGLTLRAVGYAEP
jgi:uncharacterized protein (TIGR02588 family)